MDTKNITLENTRHSCAHLLAAAVLKLFPETKLTIGPAIENGFYYDFEFVNPITDEDLPKIEDEMRKILPSFKTFSSREATVKEAKEIYKDNPYKLDLIEEIEKRGEPITLYKAGEFEDLCRGGHSKNPAEEIGAIKLLSLAGAYWRGDEKNKMLTRIYGTCFPTQKELDDYLNLLEETKKRDHKKLGLQLGLFVFSELVGPGLPLYTFKGTILRSQIVNFSRELRDEIGYKEVWTPQINKAELFKMSGHYDKYKDDMFLVKSNYASEEYYLKPMNCPQHIQIYASEMRSYKDLPFRISDFANLYRDEKPGQLSGLTRLRSFSQDDAHCFCREDQIKDEFKALLDVIEKAMKTYNMNYYIRLSLRDENAKEKYLGNDETWQKSQKILQDLLDETKVEYVRAEGEAAFYGPKMDLIAKDSLGREWQLSTIQLDFNMPARFNLEYTAIDGKNNAPIMIHSAIVGSPERFMGVLIEHYAGLFPLWLSPIQISLLPITDDQNEFASKLVEKLKAENIRVEADLRNERLQAKIREATLQKVPYLGIIGKQEIESDSVSIRTCEGKDLGKIKISDLIDRLKQEIDKKV